MTGSDRPFMSTPVSESSVGTATLRRVRPQVRPLRQKHFAIGVASIRAARLRLSYEQWHVLHLTSYLGVGLAFSHQLAGPDLAGWKMGQICWSLIYVYAYFLLLRYRFVAPMYQAWRHRLK